MSASADEPWSIGRVLTWAAADLRARGADTARLDVEVLLANVLGVDRIALVVDSARPLSKDELARYRELHKRRRAGEPVAYLIGVREFYGRKFRVDHRTLVPRPDTETLVDVALERTRDHSLYVRALDLCTGSGCVAVSLACERPTSHVLGTDISEGALEVARDNAQRLGAIPWMAFAKSDLYENVGAEPFDLITANPPYIPEGEIESLAATIRDFEPRIALTGGNDGLDIVRRIIDGAPKHLAPGGVVAMEIGAGQADAVAELLETRGFTSVQRKKDYGGIERVVSAVWDPAES